MSRPRKNSSDTPAGRQEKPIDPKGEAQWALICSGAFAFLLAAVFTPVLAPSNPLPAFVGMVALFFSLAYLYFKVSGP